MQSSSSHHKFSSTVLDFDPETLTAAVIVTGESWADEDAAASSLEETKKTFLARLQLEYALEGSSSGGKPLSAVQAEMRALADPRYEQHLELMILARKEANRSRVRYDLGKMRLELYRSLQATMRQEMSLSR
jgi:hypothetical protein